MAGFISNNNLGLTTTSYRQKDTHEGIPSDAESLTAHKNKETAPNQVVVSAGYNSSASRSLNKDNSADTGINPAEVVVNFPHCSTVFKSQSEIDIHIHEKHPEAIAEGRLQGRRTSGSLHCTDKESNSGFSSSNSFVPSNNQDTSLTSIQCSSCGKVFSRKDSLKRHLSRFPHCRERYPPEDDVCVSVKRYKCPLCKTAFTRKDHLTSHIDSLHDRPHRCRHCRERFSTQGDLDLHIPVHNKNCPYCSETFIVRNEILKHILVIHDDQDLSELVHDDESNGSTLKEGRCSFTQTEFDTMRNMLDLEDEVNASTRKKKPIRKAKRCWVCQKIIYSESAMTRHIQAHTGEKTFPCDHCDRYFANEKEQQNHLRFLNLERRFKCDQCGKGFKKKCFLDIHLIRHGSERPFQCPHCSKSYKFNMKLQEHLRFHTGEKPYGCRHCDEAFALLRQRAQHELVKHDVGRKEYKCNNCPEVFTSQRLRWIHSKSHTENVLRCEHCTYVTLFTFKMAQHKRTHTNEKPYSCDQCSRRFTQPARLQIHMRSHTGEKPYACDQCDKAFVDSYSLKRHIRTHTGEKPYKCNYCSKSFAQGCQRQFHERTHTGEKPYECSQCEKKFTRRQELNKHLKTHKKAKLPPNKKRKVVSRNSKMSK